VFQQSGAMFVESVGGGIILTRIVIFCIIAQPYY
jgi:hypothetical protein